MTADRERSERDPKPDPLGTVARGRYLNYVFGRSRPAVGSSLWVTEQRVRAAWRELFGPAEGPR